MPDLFQLPQVIPLNSGAVMPGSKLYFYQSGTSTPQAVYSDAALTTAITQPVTADSNGVFQPIYLDPNAGTYRVTLKDSNLVTMSGYPIDNYPALSIAGNQQYGIRYCLALGTANAINVTLSDPDVTSYFSGLTIIIGDNVGNTSQNVTLNVNGLGARSIYHTDGTNLYIGEISSNSTIIVTYSDLTSRFEILNNNSRGSFTGTLNGCTTSPTAPFNYIVNSGYVTITCLTDLFATSNSASMTIAGAPVAIRPSGAVRVFGAYIRDNGGDGVAMVDISPSTGVMSFSLLSVSGGAFGFYNWTSSGSKGIHEGSTWTYKL